MEVEPAVVTPPLTTLPVEHSSGRYRLILHRQIKSHIDLIDLIDLIDHGRYLSSSVRHGTHQKFPATTTDQTVRIQMILIANRVLYSTFLNKSVLSFLSLIDSSYFQREKELDLVKVVRSR